MGELDSAEKAYLRSQQLAIKHGWSLRLGDSLLGLAEISYTRKDFSSAHNYIKQSKEIYERLGRVDRLERLNNLVQMLPS
jgi:hypothetical protein